MAPVSFLSTVVLAVCATLLLQGCGDSESTDSRSIDAGTTDDGTAPPSPEVEGNLLHTRDTETKNAHKVHRERSDDGATVMLARTTERTATSVGNDRAAKNESSDLSFYLDAFLSRLPGKAALLQSDGRAGSKRTTKSRSLMRRAAPRLGLASTMGLDLKDDRESSS